ncbi:MAG: MATE family efflux transporter [Lachnospiraceae bacterium]|jgi:putative MATE family efflux protein
MQQDLTRGNLFRAMMRFSIPYLIASFLQTFYGLADLFITGRFCGVESVTAVSVGSQVMHMITVIIVGLAMGTTVTISYAVGRGERKSVPGLIGNTIVVFAIMAALMTAGLLLGLSGILQLLQVPEESLAPAHSYLLICFAGIPFITAYNVLSSIFRGLGDTRTPMIFVAIAGVINVGLDILLIGPMGFGAAGAAAATVISQALSVLMAAAAFQKVSGGIRLSRRDFHCSRPQAGKILSIGVPIACQDGLIQVSFLIITAIADSRGVTIAAAVGVVEKLISFFFLVPSAMLSTVSAVASQNAGAGRHDRSRQALHYGIAVGVIFGLAIFLLCQFIPDRLVSPFVSGDAEVVRYGSQYLRSYSFDCVVAAVHFCFSGYFCAYEKSVYSFLHNVISIFTVRIPLAWAASVYFPDNLFPMGLASPAGSAMSVILCLLFYEFGFRRKRKENAV